ncbi:hypothetical protein B296_00001968 [Ensete ventricosum]|uniref:Uncharacterized protein n=1 Tax=Ensete ventricosum TaxID=4639 RepID=A0A427B9G9_ENSVE|nr:hypothetical protein B296_00001968 [Ensete ventricosum]
MCTGDRSARRQWLAAPSPMDAWLRAIIGCKCCDAGEHGHDVKAPLVEGDDNDRGRDGSVGACRKRATMTTKNRDGNTGQRKNRQH